MDSLLWRFFTQEDDVIHTQLWRGIADEDHFIISMETEEGQEDFAGF